MRISCSSKPITRNTYWMPTPHDDRLAEMRQHYQRWHHSCRTLAQHQQLSQEREARRELLQYQLKELNEFAPQRGEFEQIDEEYKRLANSGRCCPPASRRCKFLPTVMTPTCKACSTARVIC